MRAGCSSSARTWTFTTSSPTRWTACGARPSRRTWGVWQLLDEAVFNLCDNAIKYNRPGGSVIAEVAKGDGGEILLSVTDTGIGIAPEHQERVFERFYRVDKSHSKAIGGTGLGLSIVKHVAQFHEAELKLESSPDAGTKIRLVFPPEQAAG